MISIAFSERALEAAAARSTEVGDGMPDDIRWIRSYVLGEESGALGTVCIYQASSDEAIRKHADAADRVECQRSAFWRLFGHNAEHRRPEKGLAERIERRCPKNRHPGLE